MKLFKAIILIAFLTTINFSCVQDDDYSIPESIGLEENQDLIQLIEQINSGVVDLMTISQVKSFFVSGEVTLIESNIAVKGYVVSSDMTGNFYKEFYMQDEPSNPTAGIKVVLNQVDSYNQFNIGREVYIKLQNLYIGETNSGDGVVAIGGSLNQYGNEIESITENMAAETILRSSNTTEIIPLSLNLSQINDSHIGTYVQAENVQFPNTLSGLTRGTAATINGATPESTTAAAHSSGAKVFGSYKITKQTTTETIASPPGNVTVSNSFTFSLKNNASSAETGGGFFAFGGPVNMRP